MRFEIKLFLPSLSSSFSTSVSIQSSNKNGKYRPWSKIFWWAIKFRKCRPEFPFLFLTVTSNLSFGFFFLSSSPNNLRFCLTSFFRLKSTLTSSSEIEKNSPFAFNIVEPISLVSPLSFQKFHVASASFFEKNLYVNFRAPAPPWRWNTMSLN